MFHGVCGKVHLQAGSVCVTTITVLALEWLVFVVLPTVRLLRGKNNSFNLQRHREKFNLKEKKKKKINNKDDFYLQIGQLSERLFTAWMVTLIWSVTSVYPEKEQASLVKYK